MKNPVFETMTKWSDGNWYIRVWRESNSWALGPDWEVTNTLDDIKNREIDEYNFSLADKPA